MDKLINNLNNREKLLIAIAVSVIFIFVIFAFSNNVIKSLNLSNKKLSKAKDDYEYVVSKAEVFNKLIPESKLNINEIKSYLENINSGEISDINITKENDNFMITFSTNSLKNSISLSDEISNKLNMSLIKVSYSNINKKSEITLVFTE
ncbi:MAG: hypothetical protein VXZ97_05235 [Pseudomonadota bacterium]|jgi:hypothetical protein|nr:hypothetical protein [Pseudomonadota bacterium]|tara:strand:+ start:2449 stop:2895 length:447 start_codon:yes stop_codon:yes gene_type:complete